MQIPEIPRLYEKAHRPALAALAAGALAVTTACSTSSPGGAESSAATAGSPAASAPAAPPSTGGVPATPGGAYCKPEVHEGDTIYPTRASAVFVLAGESQPNDKKKDSPVTYRSIYAESKTGKWGLAPLIGPVAVGGTITWTIGEPVAFPDLNISFTQAVDQNEDGCIPVANTPTPPDYGDPSSHFQLVTITSGIQIPTLPGSQTFASFYGVPSHIRDAGSITEALSDGAVALSVPQADTPTDLSQAA